MAAVFLRLRLTQLGNSLRRQPVQLVGMALLLAYAVWLAVCLLQLMLELSSGPVETARAVAIVVGTVVTVGYLLAALLLGGDDPLDPRAASHLGIPPARLATGLAAAGFIGIPPALVAVVAVAQLLLWADHPAAVPVAVVGGVISLAICVLGSRVLRAVAALWLSGRWVREICGLVAWGLLLAITPWVIAAWANSPGSPITPASAGRLVPLADALDAVPLAWTWSAPALAAGGRIDVAWGRLLLALVLVGALALVWRSMVTRMLRARSRAGQDSLDGGLGWFALTPVTPLWAVAARSFTYWARDGRYRLTLLAVPVVPILIMVPLSIAGVWWQNLALIPLPVMCLFLAWSIHNDIANDNTAIWLHVAARTRGFGDRIGRTIPALTIGIPLIMIGAPMTARLYGVPEVLPAVFGVCGCILLAGLGLSSYVSARFPYATTRPGDSPFAQPQLTTAPVGQAISFFGTILISAPALVLAGLWFAEGGGWGMLTLLVGLGVGVLVFAAGITAGARRFTRRAPELLASAMRN